MSISSRPSSTAIVAKASIAFCELNGGVALLDLDQSLYFSLNPVAAAIWNRIQAPATIEDILSSVEGEFDTGDRDIRPDIIALIDDLVAKDLASVHP
ncbi:PqqD family protein [uncultured Sphingomonas sp.]|uniref:PqqD family protein n=1 Tax=uncultured Sphingomonas sp. TaxID=158754 RepID=UPI0025F6ABDE|nr:PqqD family protein [uncultured Sphingomonas sp.]